MDNLTKNSTYNNEAIVVPMRYQKIVERRKKTLLFFIVAIVVCALAFTACFFAYETSRVNNYNLKLNNSIVEPQPTNPQTPQGGSAEGDTGEGGSAEGETGAQYDGRYYVIVQTVWGVEETATSLKDGMSLAASHRAGFSLTVHSSDDGVLFYDNEASNAVDLWRGGDPAYNNPYYVGKEKNSYQSTSGKETNGARRTTAGENNAIGIRKDIDKSSTGDLSVHACLQGTYAYNYKVAFMTKNIDGTMTTLTSVTPTVYEYMSATNVATYSLENFLSGDVTYIYAVITREVEIPVEYDDTSFYNLEDVQSVNLTYKKTGAENPIVTSKKYTLTKIKAYNCVYGAIGSNKLINQGYDAYFLTFTFKRIANSGNINTDPETLSLKIANGQPFSSSSKNYFDSLYECLDYNGYMDQIWAYNSDLARDTVYYYAFEMSTEASLWYLSGSDNFYLNTKLITSSLGEYDKLKIYCKAPLATVAKCDAAGGILSDTEILYCSDHGEITRNLEKLYYTSDVKDKPNYEGEVCVTFLRDFTYSHLNGIMVYNKTFIKGSGDNTKLKSETNGAKFVIDKGGSSNDASIVLYMDVTNLEVGVESTILSKIDKFYTKAKCTVSYDSQQRKQGVITELDTNSSVNQVIFNGGQVDKLVNPVTLRGQLKGTTIYTLQSSCTVDGSLTDKTYVPFKILEKNAPDGAATDVSSLQENLRITSSQLSQGKHYICKTDTESMAKNLISPMQQILQIEGNPQFDVAYETYNGEYLIYINITVTNCVEIDEYEDLVTLSGYTGFNDGTLYKLMNDICVENTFTGIGGKSSDAKASAFKGTFDGGGYSITFENSQGLFNCINGATIQNLVLEGTVKEMPSQNNSGTEAAKSIKSYFGLVGKAFGTSEHNRFKNIYNAATIGVATEEAYHTAGMIAESYHSAHFTNCAVTKAPVFNPDSFNNVQATGYKSIGQYIGHAYNSNGSATTNGYYYYIYNCIARNINKVSTGPVANFVGRALATDAKVIHFEDSHIITPTGETTLPWVGFYSESINIKKNNNCSYTATSISELTDTLNNGWGGPKQGGKSWLGEYLVMFEVGTGTELTQIKNGTDLSNRALRLKNDVTVTGWDGLWHGYDNYGTKKLSLCGLFDGDNKTIEFAGSSTQGVARCLYTATVQNVITAGTISSGLIYTGGIAGINLYGTIKNCVNNATVKSIAYYCGGIVGYNRTVVEYCSNTGNVSGSSYVGGLAGASGNGGENANASTIKFCNNSSPQIYSSGGSYIGGIVGAMDKFICSNYTHKTSITLTLTTEVGTTGYSNLYLNENENSGKISLRGGSFDYVGGVVGYNNGIISNGSGGNPKCENTANITIDGSSTYTNAKCSYVGGFCGLSGTPYRSGYGFNEHTAHTETSINGINHSGTITIEAVTSSSSYNIGGLLGFGNTSNSSCSTYIEISSGWCGSIGGLVGQGTATNSTFTGNIEFISNSKGTGPIGAIVGSGTAEKCTANVEKFCVNGSNGVSVSYNALLFGAIVGQGTATQSVFVGNVEIKYLRAEDQIYGIAGGKNTTTYGTATDCIVSGTLQFTATVPGVWALFSNLSATNCVFNFDLQFPGGIPENLILPFINKGTATRCFVKTGESKIITAPNGAAYSYIGCSTYKDVNYSLVYNGIRFGYIVDALSDNATKTKWNYNSDHNVPVYSGTQVDADNVLEVDEMDHFNAINDTVFNSNHKFCDSSGNPITTFLIDPEMEIDSTFTGFGSSEKPLVGGRFVLGGDEESYATYNNGSITYNPNNKSNRNCMLNLKGIANPLFNYVEKVKLHGFLLINLDENGKEIPSSAQSILVYSAKDSEITNCINYSNIFSTGEKVAGIVANAAYTNINDCVNYGDISSTGSYTAGIVATATNSSINNITISNCENYGNITGTRWMVAGIVASLSNATISNCYSNCVITIGGSHAGGLVGSATNATITNCITDGIMISTSGALSGILMYAQSGTVNIYNCVSFVTMQSSNYYYPHTGIAQSYVTGSNSLIMNIKNCYFFGQINEKGSVIFRNTTISEAKAFNTTPENCGYNMNNKEIIGAGARLIYAQSNPVWSAQAYIKNLLKTDTIVMLNVYINAYLDWNNTYEFETLFWQSIFVG